MNIIGEGLGYRELSRLANFIDKISNGNYLLNAILGTYEYISIEYDLKRDEVIVRATDEYGLERIYEEDQF